MKIKIGIEKMTLFSCQITYYVTAKLRKEKITLFKMQPWWGCWRFSQAFGRDETIAKVPGSNFPEQYFKDLCKATYFTQTGILKYPDDIELYKGQRYLEQFKKEYGSKIS